VKKINFLIYSLLPLCWSNTLLAGNSFSAICTLKTQHHYNLANKADFHPAKNPLRMIDEWSINNEFSTAVTVNYSDGDKYLQITDSRQTEPIKAPIIFYNGNTMYALYLGKGANEGELGATTRTYSINRKAKTIVTNTLKSSNFMSPHIEASTEGSPECVFKTQ